MRSEPKKPTVQIPERIGKYQIQGLLGRGGMGAVYIGYQSDLDRTVAVKVLIAGEFASEEMIIRFMREARAVAKLVHPYIVQIHDVGSDGALHYIVMEHINGKSVADWMELRPLTVEQAMRIAYFAARALEFAHDNGVIHRDVKPSNIVIDNSGRIRLLDFGLSKMISADNATLTRSGTVMGTPAYMPPEAAFGTMDEVDARSDIYSLGAVLYEMLCGRTPFPGENVYSILRKIEEDEPDPPTSVKPGVPYEAEAICLRAMAKKKADRFKTAGEMAAAIQHFLGEEPSQVSTALPSPGWPRRRTVLIAAIAAPLLLTAGALAAFIFRSKPSAPAARPHATPSTPVVPPSDLVAKLESARGKPSGSRLTILMDVLARTPAESDDLGQLLVRARALRLTGRFEEAARTLSRVLDQTSDPELVFEYALARSFCRDALSVYWWDGFLNTSSPRDFEPLFERVSASAEPWRSMTRALAMAALGRLDDAEGELENFPENWSRPEANIVGAHVRMLQRLAAQTPPTQAEAQAEGERAIERARALDPDDPLVIFLRGMVRTFKEGAGPAEEAARDLGRCSAERAAEPRVMSAILYHHAGNAALRESELRRSQKLSPDTDVQVWRLWAKIMLISSSSDPRTPDVLDPILQEIQSLVGEGGPRPARAFLLSGAAKILRMPESEGFSDPSALDDFVRYLRHPGTAARGGYPLHKALEEGLSLDGLDYSDATDTAAEIEAADRAMDDLREYGWGSIAFAVGRWILRATAAAVPDMEETRRAELRREAYYRSAQIFSDASPKTAIDYLKAVVREGAPVDDLMARVRQDAAFGTLLQNHPGLEEALRNP